MASRSSETRRSDPLPVQRPHLVFTAGNNSNRNYVAIISVLKVSVVVVQLLQVDVAFLGDADAVVASSPHLLIRKNLKCRRLSGTIDLKEYT